MKAGKVYLVGGGCGDAGLVTCKAADVLRNCDTVVYDSLVSEELLQWTKADCEKIYVGKRYGSHALKQDEINILLAKKAREGKTVARLKGGDPYVFGRGGEEFLAMKKAGVGCEEIPGISSAIAVPAAAGIPVTHRGLSASVTVVTGTAAQEDGRSCLKLDFDALARLDGTLVILMGMHHLQEIADGLMAAGKSPETPCAVIMEGSTARQKCMRTVLSELFREASRQGYRSPAVIVVGAVAGLELIPEDKKLSGVTVGLTGTPHFVKKLSAALGEQGARVWDMGFMEICENKEPLPDFNGYGWLVFTSPNGAQVFLDKMRKERRDLRTLWGKGLAAIGPGTAAVFEEAGLYVDYVPEIYDVFHLAQGLAAHILEEAGQAVRPDGCLEVCKNAAREIPSAIFLRAKEASPELSLIFSEKGISFLEHPLYELAVREERRAGAVTKMPDYIVFGSAMGVRAYFQGMEQGGIRNEKSCYICIGERCGEELRKHMDATCLVAEKADVTGIVECLCRDRAQK